MIKSVIGDSTTVGSWLDSLDKTQKDAFLYYCKNSVSDIEAFLYARFLNPGYTGSISDLTAYVQEKYPKEDLRKVLLIEIDSLKIDIDNVRQMTLTGMLDHATAATKISVLQKELRSAIARLPEYLREVIALRDLAEMPYSQVAKILGITASSARAYRSKAVTLLAAWMAKNTHE